MTKLKFKKYNVKKVGKFFDDLLAGDSEDGTTEEIIEKLKKALEKNPDETLDYVDGITVWEKIELEFTVRTFCEHIGLID